MSSLAPDQVALPAADRAEPPARFRDLLAAEWIKLRSLRSTKWTVGLIVLMVIGAAAVAAYADYGNFPRYSPMAQREHLFAFRDAMPQPGYWTLMLAASGVGAISVVSEYSSGLIRTTTVAVPARASVIAAKAVVLSVVWAVLGALMALAAYGVSQAILAGRHAALPLTSPGMPRALLACALLAPVSALIGLGLGVLIRHSASTVVGAAFTLLLLPEFLSEHRRWSADLNHTMVRVAWDRLTVPWNPPPEAGFHVPTILGSWLVFAAWPLAAVLLALLVVRRRDV
jgi:hypothetical protein